MICINTGKASSSKEAEADTDKLGASSRYPKEMLEVVQRGSQSQRVRGRGRGSGSIPVHISLSLWGTDL